MNKGYGVQVTVGGESGAASQVTPVVVVAADERDAELIAERAGGAGASAETLRELTDEEVTAHGLDLQARGSVKALPVLDL